MVQKTVRRKFTKEFKQEAVSLVIEQGYSITEAANSLGIGTNVLSRWKRDFEDQESGQALSDDERDELKRLRRENKQLRMEKEILKKASAFFAKEM